MLAEIFCRTGKYPNEILQQPDWVQRFCYAAIAKDLSNRVERDKAMIKSIVSMFGGK